MQILPSGAADAVYGVASGFLSLTSLAEYPFPTSLHRICVSNGPAHRPAALLHGSFKILDWYHMEKQDCV